MKYFEWMVCLMVLILVVGCQTKEANYNEEIEVFKTFSELQSIIDAEKDQLLVINFWATSCPPCIKEMPHFNKLECFRSKYIFFDRFSYIVNGTGSVTF